MIVIHDRVMIFSLKYIFYILSVAGIIQLRQYLVIIEEPQMPIFLSRRGWSTRLDRFAGKENATRLISFRD